MGQPAVQVDPNAAAEVAAAVKAPKAPVIIAVQAQPMSGAELAKAAAAAVKNKEKLFETNAPIAFGLAANFTQIQNDKQGLKDAQTVIPGVLTSDGKTANVEILVRGESSTSDLPFPKLKIKLAADSELTNGFKAKRKFELGVHGNVIGAGQPGQPPVQQWSGYMRELDDFAPRREALAYNVLEAFSPLGMPVPATRVGVTDYVDTKGDADGANDIKDPGHSTLLVESIGDMAKRWGGKELEGDAWAAGPYKMRPNAKALIDMAEALIGNTDYWYPEQNAGDHLEVNSDVHNGKIIQLADGWATFAPTDFDLTAWTLTNGTQAAQQWGGFDVAQKVSTIGTELTPEQRLDLFQQVSALRDDVTKRVTDYPLSDGDPQKDYLIGRVKTFFDAVDSVLAQLKPAAPAAPAQ
jgi:hypothetical protein